MPSVSRSSRASLEESLSAFANQHFLEQLKAKLGEAAEVVDKAMAHAVYTPPDPAPTSAFGRAKAAKASLDQKTDSSLVASWIKQFFTEATRLRGRVA